MKKKMTFEEAMDAIEKSVTKLESADLGIDEAMDVFEEALALVKFCNKTITEAEQKVRILLSDENGEVTDAPFTENKDEN